MSRLRGRCEVCGGPLWRKTLETYTVRACRICALDETRTMDAHWFVAPTGRWPLPTIFDTARQAAWLHAEADARLMPPDEANSTAASPATSRWLPMVWVNDREKPHAAFSDENIANAGSERGPVFWFRTLDLVEVPAADTLLARQLRDET